MRNYMRWSNLSEYDIGLSKGHGQEDQEWTLHFFIAVSQTAGGEEEEESIRGGHCDEVIM